MRPMETLRHVEPRSASSPRSNPVNVEEDDALAISCRQTATLKACTSHGSIGRMDHPRRRPRLVLRMNAAVEGFEAGFELFGPQFQWYGFLLGRCGFTIDEYDFRPPGGPPLPADSETEVVSLESLVEIGLTYVMARAYTDFARCHAARKHENHVPRVFNGLASSNLRPNCTLFATRHCGTARNARR